MAEETPGPSQVPAGRGGWRVWLRLAMAAVALLILSEAIWLWQTWPVRELLRPVAASEGRQP